MHKNLEMKFPFNVIDLTHPLSSDLPSWDMSYGFQCSNTLDYKECTTDVKFRVQNLKLAAGIGTHIDAPAHCIPGGRSIDQLSLDELIVPFCLIDVAEKSSANYLCSVEDIKSYEHQYGKIPKNDFTFS